MPGFDGTGPQGAGEMTGRGQGFCVVSQQADIMYGGGFGLGRRVGRGRRGGGYGYGLRMGRVQSMNSQQEADMLKKELTILQQRLSSIQERIQEIEKSAE